MPTRRFAGRTLDARPDRVDLRDRRYLPRLASLPERFPDPAFIATELPEYTKAGLILDQQSEGACTGFGLAAVINYIGWKRGTPDAPVRRVSPRMLYHLARFYDEWPGEDYEGSSCRGAMKGWHRHGVCDEETWPYLDVRGKFVRPRDGWEANAAQRPLGAYYRVDRKSIVDMQAAIVETGAIYVSADVHAGWDPRKWKTSPDGIAIISVGNPASVGGHAFALVGYTTDGFIVQNSWGPAWGTGGFAILTYDDWVKRGADAWVAALGAPTASGAARKPTIIDVRAALAQGSWSVSRVRDAAEDDVYRRWDERRAYLHTIVTGNNGIVLNRIPDCAPGLAALERVVHDGPAQWLNAAKGRTKLVLYAHGGLNSEERALARVRSLGPHFADNDVYPLFFAWKTGVLETLTGVLDDWLSKLGEGMRMRGFWGDLKDAAQETKDRLIESACQELHVKAIWAQMKQNAEAARTEPDPTLGLAVTHLAALKQRVPSLEIHLVGHSAGAILLGHLLDALSDPAWAGPGGLKASSCTLLAPACTVDFALTHYLGAVGKALPNQDALSVEILTDERERADTVGPYGRSLLYLVSRGLESHHKTPLLGLDTVWSKGGDWGNEALAKQVRRWRKQWHVPAVLQGAQGDASDGRQSMPWKHSTFDNDVDVITRTIRRIRRKKLVAAITALSG